MQTRYIFLVLLVTTIALSAADKKTPLPAAEVIKSAQAIASTEDKAILVVFHASWCGWCKRLDQFLEAKETKPVIEKYFVVKHLTVLERPTEQASENPGGEEWMNKLGGKGAGLPFFAMLDAKGELIVSSVRTDKEKGGNIGHPFQPEEISWFMSMAKKAAPKMSDEDAGILETWLQKRKRS